jgi:hypothetical protein
VLIGSKLTGVTQSIDSSTALASITPIVSESNGVTLLTDLGKKIKVANECIQSAVNSSTSTVSCMETTYLNAGMNASRYIQVTRADVGQLTSVGYPSVQWCQFTDSSLDFNSPANLLAGKTGECLASYTATATDGAGVISDFYKFTLNSTGSGVSELKAFGNQINSELDIYPLIKKKVRVDGFTTNTGVTSGYAFDIGTALAQTNGTPTVTSNSVLSAKIEVINAAEAKYQNGAVLGTFYMQCQQGANCNNSNLAVCTTPACTQVDTIADNIVSVNSGLSSAIIAALQQGHVYAKVTAYNKILSDGSKQTKYTKTLPITGIPVAQSVVDQLTFPSLSNNSKNALRDWAGESSLSLTIDGGDPKFALMDLEFGAQPSAGITWKSTPVSRKSTTVNMTGITGNGTSIIASTTSACASLTTQSNQAYWRAANIRATYKDVLVDIKHFGSCSQYDY